MPTHRKASPSGSGDKVVEMWGESGDKVAKSGDKLVTVTKNVDKVVPLTGAPEGVAQREAPQHDVRVHGRFKRGAALGEPVLAAVVGREPRRVRALEWGDKRGATIMWRQHGDG